MFDTFFELSHIVNPVHQIIAKDMLCAAAASYLEALSYQEKTSTRSENLKEFKRAKRASRDLSDSLELLLEKANFSFKLMDVALPKKKELISKFGADSDTYKLLSEIFPFDVEGDGFKTDGLKNMICVLADLISEVEDVQFVKSEKGRIFALEAWVSVMGFYWISTKGKLPKVGHYDTEIADYDSSEVAALTYAAQQIDADISSRLIVKSLDALRNQILTEHMKPLILMMVSLDTMIRSGEAYTPQKYFEYYFNLFSPSDVSPEGSLDETWGSAQSVEATASEKCHISAEQFYETLLSSKGGNMLLHIAMENGPS